MCSLAAFGFASVWAAVGTADPVPKGARSCSGNITYQDAVSTRVFARGVSCGYARRYVHWCFHSSSLHGWRFHGEEGFTGYFRLTRGAQTLWLDEAGGGAKCLNQ